MDLFVPDGRPSRSALEEIAAQASGQLSMLPSMLGYQDGTGLTTVATAPPGVWVRITAGPLSNSQPLYSFAEVQDDGTGYGWQNVTGGLTGTNNAAATNKSTTVPAGANTGAVVWLVPDDGNPGFYKFFWEDVSSPTSTLIASSALYTNTVFPNATLTQPNWSGVIVGNFGSTPALAVSGSNLQLPAAGTYRVWLDLRPQFNPVVAGTYGAWITLNAPSGVSPFYASSYAAGSLNSFTGTPAVPNPGLTVGPSLFTVAANTTVYFQLYQSTGGTVILSATVYAEKIG
jgi:hypothetical protein